MEINEHLAVELEDTVLWVDTHARKFNSPIEGERLVLAAGCYNIALEYQAGMLLLYKADMFALMFATLRLIFEALVRGLWLERCANEKQVTDFAAGQSPKKLEVYTKDLEREFVNEILPLESYRIKLEGHLHAFTHTGSSHLIRNRGDFSLGANYSDQELGQAINIAVLVGLQAAARLGLLSSNKKIGEDAMKRMAAYGRRYSALKATRGD